MKTTYNRLSKVLFLALLMLGFQFTARSQAATHLHFDGTNDLVRCGTDFNAVFSSRNTVTVEAWVRPESTSGLGHIAGNYSYPTNNASMQFLLRRDGNAYVFWMRNSTNTGFVNVVASNAVVLNTWQHVVGVRNGDQLMIYVNGTLINTTTGIGAQNFIPNIGNEFTIGGDAVVPFPEFFLGSIDEVRVWTTAVSEPEIVRRKNCELQGNEAGLYAYYNFNQGVAGGTNTTVTTLNNNSITSGINGVVTNMALTGATSNWLGGSTVITGSSLPSAPTASAQSFCVSGTVANLVPAPSATINWYNVATGGTALTGATPLATGTYFVAAVNANGCESIRTSVSISVHAIPAAPTVAAQNICGTGTAANLVPAPSVAYKWYSVATGGAPLTGATVLSTGTYYVSYSIIPGCESARTAVNVAVHNGVIYVKADATGDNNGSSWANAFTSLQSALEINCALSQDIWVAAGTYKPTNHPSGSFSGQSDPRNRTFEVRSNTKIYGGFAGYETSLLQRNLVANPSILDGDIGVAGDSTDNCYHVVLVLGSPSFSGATIDGFHIRNGNADGSGVIMVSGFDTQQSNGGGLNIKYHFGNRIINNTIYNNSSTNKGAGLYMAEYDGSKVDTISNNVFFGNNANAGSGGGAYLEMYSIGYVNGNTFYNNSAQTGGGMFTQYGNTSFKISNNIIYNNSAAIGAGIYMLSTRGTFAHNTLSNNKATVEGGGSYFRDNIGGYLATINNNIFWQNKQNNSSSGSGADFAKGSGGSFFTLKNNSLQLTTGNYTTVGAGSYDLGTTASGNLFAQNPLFLNEASPAGADALHGTSDDGFQVLCTSALLNAGLSGTGVANDLLVSVRNPTTPTIGAYEVANITNGVLATSFQSVTSNQSNSTLYGSCSSLIASLKSNGALPVSGSTTAKVWIEGTQNSLFVKRHYEVTPASNASIATGTLTLYFTQQEFTDFNLLNTVKLPTGAADAAGIANLKIEKRSGISGDGTGLPHTYTGDIVTIDPIDTDIIWNITENRWEISFQVTGFSGFFVKTSAFTLPVRLLSFTATKQNSLTKLQWRTGSELNTKNFDLQVGTSTNRFTSLAVRNAKGFGDNEYEYEDRTAYNGRVYYRLKVIDLDGHYEYSNIISIDNRSNSIISVTPNPVKSVTMISINNKKLLNSKAKLFSIDGRLHQTITIKSYQQQVNLVALSAGTYLLQFEDGSTVKLIKE